MRGNNERRKRTTLIPVFSFAAHPLARHLLTRPPSVLDSRKRVLDSFGYIVIGVYMSYPPFDAFSAWPRARASRTGQKGDSIFEMLSTRKRPAAPLRSPFYTVGQSVWNQREV